MRAVVTTDEHTMQLANVPRPVLEGGMLLLEVEFAGVCGSDLHALHMAGAGRVFGHEFVGRVVEVAPDVHGFALGDRVCAVPAVGCGSCLHCLSGEPIHCAQMRSVGFDLTGGFAEYVLVGAQWSVKVPDTVSSRIAALAEPLSVGSRILDRADVRPGETVVILGAGPIGLAVTLWCDAMGVGRVLVSEPVTSRRELALALGATASTDPTAESLAEAAREHLGGPPDVVIECAGRPGMLTVAVDLVRPKGRIVLAGLHGEDEVFHRLPPLMKEVLIVFPNFTSVSGFEKTLEMLGQGRIDPSRLITHQVTLEELPDIFTALQAPNAYGKVLVTPQPA